MFASDDSGQLIAARLAKKQTDYSCLECRGPVRLRKGKHRQPHFFHLSHNRLCRQSGKSQIHLCIQQHLQEILPHDEVILECRFPKISRIADVVWLRRRLVFEVQCSPISQEEVLARNRDYKSEGFQVVWILHERRFNQWRMTAAEEALQKSPCYFTNFTAAGKGIIYDQASKVHGGRRRRLSPCLKVDLSVPQAVLKRKTPYPLVNQRLDSWPVSFQGDLLDVWKSGKAEWLKETMPAEPKRRLWGWLKALNQGYLSLIKVLLERASR